MSDYDDDTTSDLELQRLIREVKPGFAVVPSNPSRSDAPRTRVRALPTPDLATLRRKGRSLGLTAEPLEAENQMDDRTASLMNKFLKADQSTSSRDAGLAPPEPKQRGKIVSVRPDSQQDAGAAETAPKDVQMVFDKKGTLGETS